MGLARKITGSALFLMALWNAWWLGRGLLEGAGTLVVLFCLMGLLACSAAMLLLYLPARSEGVEDAVSSLRGMPEEWKTLAVESARECILLIDERLLIRYANPAVESMFGYSKNDVLGKSLPFLVPSGATRHAARRPIESGLLLLETGRRKDASEFPIEIVMRKVADREGMRAVAVIAESRAAETNASTALSRIGQLEQLWLDAPVPLVVFDGHGRIVRWNRVCEDATSYALAELGKSSYWDVFLEGDAAELARQAWLDTASLEGLREVRENWRTRSGAGWDVVWMRKRLASRSGASPAVIAAGAPPGSAFDRLEAARLTLRMDDQLTALQGHSELLLAMMDQSDSNRQGMEEIYRAACRAVEIARQWRSLLDHESASSAAAG